MDSFCGRTCLLMLWIFFAASPAYCSTYFVATDGNDSNDGLSIDHPFKTIPKAVGVAAAGDTIYVRGGTYTYSGSSTAITLPAKSGASDANRCYLFGYQDERPLLDFTAMTGTSADGLKINGSYWYLKGIDFKGAPHNGIKISGGSYNIVEFCSSYENRNTGVQLGGGAAYNQIINCDSYYNCDAIQEDADGFAPKLDVGTGNYFYGCRSWQNADDAYDGYLRPSNDINTTYENCWAFKAGYLKSGAASYGDGNGYKMGGSDDKLLKHNVILKNCLAFNNRVKGFDQNNNKGSMTLYNCTAFSNVSYNYSITSALPSGKTATVTNCVYHGTGGKNLGGFVVQTTNSWNPPFVVTDADFVSIDPNAAYGARKADGSLPDINFMHLAASSDLINGGTDVGLPYHGSAPDLGYFEYGGCTSPVASDLDSNCQVDLFDYARLADAWAGNLPDVDLNNDGFLDFLDIAQFAIDWLSCNRDPASECWQ
ncbi:MAG: right-handed parallel beta-helix repeat-containing protein [Sedimentisphaerales bacterium]|nr:right-handed parallel beta-helix repeat-containing protein [Sedimentisphaerales bacterium]